MSDFKRLLQARKHVPVNTCMIGINVITFVILSCLGDVTDGYFMYMHGANQCMDVFLYHEYYRLLTCTFIHFGIMHLINNMIVLTFVGDLVEQLIGSVSYLFLYLMTGIGSSFISSLYNFLQEDVHGISGGASGVGFGMSGALLAIVLYHKGKIAQLRLRQVVLFVVFSVYAGFTSDGIDITAHIAGLIIGFITGFLFYLFRCHRKKKIKSRAC